MSAAAPCAPPATASLLHHPRVTGYASAIALTMWAVLAINMASSGVISMNGHLKGEDYAHFYVLGHVGLNRALPMLYDMAGQAAYVPQVIPGSSVTHFLPVYGPQVALLFAPFAALPYLASLALWSALSVLAYVACCRAFLRFCPALQSARTQVTLLLLASPALWQVVVHGQNTALALTALTIGWVCFRKDRPLVAGLAFGVLFYKPQLALVLAVVCLALGRWSVLTGMAWSAAAQLVAGALWFGPAVFDAYGRSLLRLPSTAPLLETKPFLSHSLYGFFTLLPPLADHAVALAALSSMAIVAVAIRHWRSTRDVDLSFALTLIATALVSPHMLVYDLAILTPALMVIADRLLAADAARSSRQPRDTRGFVLVVVAFVAPFSSVVAAYLLIQPSVICLVWLMLHVNGSGRSEPRTAAGTMVPVA